MSGDIQTGLLVAENEHFKKGRFFSPFQIVALVDPHEPQSGAPPPSLSTWGVRPHSLGVPNARRRVNARREADLARS